MSLCRKWTVRAFEIAFGVTLFVNVAPAVAAGVGEAAPAPSLCISVSNGCHVLGSKVRATVRLGLANTPIAGGQFSVEYDPTVLRLVDISPGASCDPSSLFLFETSEIIDETNGEIFYSVNIDPFGDGQGATGPTTMACLEFVLLDRLNSAVCLFDGVNPRRTRLLDTSGRAVQIDNTTDCPAAEPLPTLSCDQIDVADSCTCGVDVPDCTLLDDACNVGVCMEETVQCEAVHRNEGGFCDDHDACTSNEVCRDGACIGTDCENPSLCVVADESCPDDNLARRDITIMLGESDRTILGAQFSIQYDPTVLQLVSASPGNACDESSPFTEELAENINPLTGELFYAVLVDPFGGGPEIGTRGPATLACLEFSLVGISGSPSVCLFTDANPFRTLLAGFEGGVPVFNAVDCPTSAPPPAISCADVCKPIPTLSEWGIVILAILLMTVEKLYFSLRMRRRAGIASATERGS